MRNFIVCILLLSSTIVVMAQNLVSYELLSSTNAAFLPFIPGISNEYDVDFYKVMYNTVDVNGDATVASGALAVPVSLDCIGFPMAIYQHGTTLNKENVPSRENSEADIVKVFASNGYYVVAPDYIGMGDNPGLHPYVHAESEATAGRDLIRAGREVIEELNNLTLTIEIDELFITGYSQGGHAAMALHKHIEDNDLLDEFNIIGSAPASGPYNMSGAQTEVILSDAPYSNPGYLVYLMAAYELAYGNIFNSYSDILNSPHDETVVPYFNGNNTTLSMAQLNPQLPNQISDLMPAVYLDAFTNDPMHPLRVALEDNNNYDWAPQIPVRIYYCTGDEQVNFQNSIDAIEAMTAAGAEDVQGFNGGPFNHSLCVLPSLSGALNWFNDTKTGCDEVGINEYEVSVNVSPNPVTDLLEINVDTNIDYLMIHAIDGKVVLEKRCSNIKNLTLNLKEFESGNYVLTLYAKEKLIASKTIVKR